MHRPFAITLFFSFILALTPCAFSRRALSETNFSIATVLRDVGMQVEMGTGTVNGVDVPTGVIQPSDRRSDVFAAHLLKVLRSRYTVTENLSPQGVVLIAWNLKSPVCASCSPASVARLEELFDTAIVITFYEAPQGGTVALASSAGALRRAGIAKGRYAGMFSEKIAASWRIDLQTAYQFGETRHANHLAWSPDQPSVVEARIRASFEAAGLLPLTQKVIGDGAGLGIQKREATYAASYRAAYYQLTPAAEGGTTIQLVETTNPGR